MSAILRGNLRMALSGVKSSKWRSFLTMLGIIVGIVAVVLVVGIGEGVKRQIASTLHHFGKELIIVRPAQMTDQSGGNMGRSDILFGMSSTVRLSNADVAVVRRAEGVRLTAPLGVVPGNVEAYGKAIRQAKVIGTGADLPAVLNQNLAYGDFWTDDSDADAHFAVLGRLAAETLFGEPVPLGKSLVFRGQSFQVRGIFAPFKDVPFSPTANFDHMIFIPYKTGAQLTNNATGPYVILAKAASASVVGSTIRAVEDELGSTHGGERDFSVLESSKSLEAGSELIQLLSLWIFAVAVISLLMGGVGIMNIMLLVVAERMHEIGVRKAVGATSRQILGQFVLEATVISVVGGIVGVVISSALIGVLYFYTDLKPVLSWQALAVATGVSVAMGIIFGAIPAIKAARKDPIEALRHE